MSDKCPTCGTPARFSEPPNSSWQPIKTIPENGKHIKIETQEIVKFKAYRPGASQLKKGIKGRWQKLSFDYGGWSNCEDPKEIGNGWKYAGDSNG